MTRLGAMIPSPHGAPSFNCALAPIRAQSGLLRLGLAGKICAIQLNSAGEPVSTSAIIVSEEQPKEDSPQPVAGESPHSPERRDFIKQAASVCIGGAIGVVPVVAGIAVYLDPLNHKSAGSQRVKVTTLSGLPQDGKPRKFSVYADKKDAWTTFPKSPVGAVYITRTGEKELKVLNVVCPHAGCFVDYVGRDDEFFCPCHDSSFKKDGSIKSTHSPSPRPLDELEYEIDEDEAVWVEFINFLAGQKEKVPV
ncbi:MAG: menaquinol-cytochrome c reductase iron-sulfur subunit [Limisphaerales bacterium]|jgi:menaquinol-cytochrome c reductase iron-sulfur subunit